MIAAYYESFSGPISIEDLPIPECHPDSVIIRVAATGICRSDWHGWQGHDPDVVLPHVPGHEFSGVIEEPGNDVSIWNKGQRVTVPFVCGCGKCNQCKSGNEQVCDHQTQPGFTHWGSFAEFVEVRNADHNLVALQESMDFTSAASLGCRFSTSFRGIVHQGHVKSGEWVAIFGCGGVGLSAIMIAQAKGARVIGVDISPEALEMAMQVGAERTINTMDAGKAFELIREMTDGGVHLAMDALGDPDTCRDSILSLRKRGRHVQVGLMPPSDHKEYVPMDAVIARELEIVGSHGMQAHRYPEMMEMIENGEIDPSKLITRTVNLKDGIEILTNMDKNKDHGVNIIQLTANNS